MDLDFKGKNIMKSAVRYISFKLCLIDVKRTSFIRNYIRYFFIMRYVVFHLHSNAICTSYSSYLKKRNLMSIMINT